MESCGLYIHVPFCVKKCNYCDFLSFKYEKELAERYLLALFSELKLLAEKYHSPVVKTIYLGGGTPTCLGGRNLAHIISVIRNNFKVNLQELEVTCELNPATVCEEDLRLMHAAGINRLSMGVQAFDERLLRYLGRVHGLAAVYETYHLARKIGFSNINLDLIFAIPGQTKKDWHNSLKAALELQPEHLSLYNLKIEEGTPFYRDLIKGTLIPVDEDLDLWMYEEAIRILADEDLNQYEISNFARSGFQSKHNLTYWHYRPYLGAGPGAHGFDGQLRYENCSNLQEYSNTLQTGSFPHTDIMELTDQDQMEEYLIMGLRLMEGIDLNEFLQRFGQPLMQIYGQKVTRLQNLGLVELCADKLALTEAGIPLGNIVFQEFLL